MWSVHQMVSSVHQSVSRQGTKLGGQSRRVLNWMVRRVQYVKDATPIASPATASRIRAQLTKDHGNLHGKRSWTAAGLQLHGVGSGPLPTSSPAEAEADSSH